MDTQFWTFLGKLGAVFGVITPIPIFWSWYELAFGRHRRRRKALADIVASPGSRPAVLILDLLAKGNVESQVINFLKGSESLKNIPPESIFRIVRDRPLNGPEDMRGLAAEIRRNAALAMDQGTDVVHCFYAGPAIAMAHVGREFSNGARLMLYQHSPSRSMYENFGPLNFDRLE